jgi:hypothetical protein
MCSRTEATLRLIAAWLDRAVDDPDFPYRVTLADLTEDNIAVVSEMDLLTVYSDEERQKKAAGARRGNNPQPSNVARLACTKIERCGVAVTVADLRMSCLSARLLPSLG